MSAPTTVDTSGTGPLRGLRVVELAALGPAPFACSLLAELGATVVRVDRPGGSGLAAAPSSGLNRSRPNVAVNLKHPQGRGVVERLVEQADVLIEGWRPGVAERLGLGPEECLQRNERLIYARMTGWGQDGPLADRAGHDITYAALTGALHAVGTREKPMPPVNLIADFGGGSLYLVAGVLAALFERTTSGRGQVIDAAMVDGAASLVTMLYCLKGAGGWVDQRESNLVDGGAPFYDTYRCQDGKYVAVGAIEPQFYAQLLDGLGLTLEGDQLDQSRWPANRLAFEAAFATRSRDEWAEHFVGTDACVAPVLSLDEAPRHPHMAARDIFTEVDGVVQPRVAPRFSRTPGAAPGREHRVGEDTVDTLGQWGFGAREIEQLLAEGAVVAAPGAPG
jgi:alpha-methylacyl-CoA racemase